MLRLYSFCKNDSRDFGLCFLFANFLKLEACSDALNAAELPVNRELY